MPNDQPDYTAVVNSQTALFSGVSVAQDGTTHDLGVATVPSNTHSLEVVWITTTQILALNAIGQQSGLDWAQIGLPRLGSLTAPRAVMPLRRAIDNQVDMKIGFQTGSGSAKVWVIAMTDPSMEVIDASQPGSEVIVDPASGNKAGVLASSNPNGNLQTTLAFADPAPWQAPDALADSGFITSNTTTAMVAPVFAHPVYIFGWEISLSGSTGGVLARLVAHLSGKTLGELSGSGNVSAIGYHGGLNLGGSEGVDLVTDSVPTGGSVRATLGYRQP